MSIGSASCFKKTRGSDPDNSYISYIVLCDGRYLGRIFYTDAGVPKDAAGFGVSKFHEWQGRKGPQ